MRTVTVNTVEEFNEFLTTAFPNDRAIYHTGSGLTNTTYMLVLKHTVWQMAIKGHVYLVQKKLESDKYQFIAIKASENPNKKLIPFPYGDEDRPRARKSNVNTYEASAPAFKYKRMPKSLLERVS